MSMPTMVLFATWIVSIDCGAQTRSPLKVMWWNEYHVETWTIGNSLLPDGTSEEFFLTGSTHDHHRLFTAMIDRDGTKVWDAVTSGSMSCSYGISMVQASEGNILSVGDSYGCDVASYAIFLSCFSPIGKELWTKSALRHGKAHSISKHAEDGFLISGIIGQGPSELFLINVDGTGNIRWNREYRISTAISWSETLHLDRENAIVACSDSGSNGWLIKIDSKGDEVWRTEPLPALIRAIIMDPRGSMIVVGKDRNDPEWQNNYFARVGPDGDILFENVLDLGFLVTSIGIDNGDGTLLVSGNMVGTNDEDVLSLAKVTLDFSLIWKLALDIGHENGGLMAMKSLRDGEVIIASNIFINDDMRVLVLKLGPLGSQDLFSRGDSNGDGAIDLFDALLCLRSLFLDSPEPSCLDAADVNDDGRLDISDAISLLYALFGEFEIPSPRGGIGIDPTADGLGCG